MLVESLRMREYIEIRLKSARDELEIQTLHEMNDFIDVLEMWAKKRIRLEQKERRIAEKAKARRTKK